MWKVISFAVALCALLIAIQAQGEASSIFNLILLN